MKRTLTVLVLALLAFIGAPTAGAATAWMGGLGGTQPGFSTITGPNGETVSTAWQVFGGDERIGWDNISQDSAVKAQIAWLEKHQGEQNTLWTYSATSNSINKVAALRPDLLANTTVIAIAPPKATSIDYAAVPTPSTFRQYQVIVDGDSVADEDGTSFNTHTGGYRNLNLQTAVPISSTVLHDTNTTRSYYTKPGTTTKSSFRLFDMRTWFAPKTTLVKKESNGSIGDSETRGGDSSGVRLSSRRVGDERGDGSDRVRVRDLEGRRASHVDSGTVRDGDGRKSRQADRVAKREDRREYRRQEARAAAA